MDQTLLDSIRQAIQTDASARQAHTRLAEVNARLDLLTPRERQVLEMVVAGKTNKGIAVELDLSKKTVEFHRGNIMRKMEVETVAQLIHVFLQHKNAT